MSETKFTEGEWKVSGFSVSCKGAGYIAKALEVFMCKSERKANSHLIAAAPKMYAMLEELSGYDENQMHKQEIDKLLAEARGEL
jgi:hypothetical protein